MADTANNRQFSVMVDSGGVLSYPQNFITANSLAKFGSDVNGTFNHLTTTRIEAESKTFGMPTVGIDFIPVEMTNGEYIISKILFDCGGDTGVDYIFPLLSISRPETLIKGSDVINLQSSNYDSRRGTSISVKASELSLEHNNKIKSKDGDSSNCITLNDTGIDVGVSYSYLLDDGFSSTAGKNNILINMDKITVSAPLVELPSNTTIGGVKPAAFGSNVDATLNSLNTTKVGGLTGSEYIEFTSTDENGNGSAVSFYTDDGASIQKRFEIAATSARLNIPYGNIELLSDTGISLESGGIIELISSTGISLNSGDGMIGNITLQSTDISLNSSGMVKVSSQQEDGNGSVEIGLSYSYFDEIKLDDVIVNNNVLITKDKITVSAPLVELPANTTIGGKSVATGAPSNMVTTDTEQTITGNKTFTGNSITFGDWANNEISVNFNKAKIIANSGIDADDQLRISSGNGGPLFGGSAEVGEKVTFEIPQYLRVFDTVTKKWTDTYKYTYLAKDASGNVTLVISDTNPTD